LELTKKNKSFIKQIYRIRCHDESSGEEEDSRILENPPSTDDERAYSTFYTYIYVTRTF